MARADQAWGAVTTGMHASHEYVGATRELHNTLTSLTHDGAQPQSVQQLAEHVDLDQALVDIRYATADTANLMRACHQVAEPLVRSGLLFAPARAMRATASRLPDRVASRWIPLEHNDAPGLRRATRDAAEAAQAADHTIGATLDRRNLAQARRLRTDTPGALAPLLGPAL